MPKGIRGVEETSILWTTKRMTEWGQLAGSTTQTWRVEKGLRRHKGAEDQASGKASAPTDTGTGIPRSGLPSPQLSK